MKLTAQQFCAVPEPCPEEADATKVAETVRKEVKDAFKNDAFGVSWRVCPNSHSQVQFPKDFMSRPFKNCSSQLHPVRRLSCNE
jgi:hypothetical protein